MPVEPPKSNIKPECCPVCKSEHIAYAVEWFTHSLDPCDYTNIAVVMEYQCRDCNISFWL